MKTPCTRKPEEPPRCVIVNRRNHPDWRERYWKAVLVLMPELREESVAEDEGRLREIQIAKPAVGFVGTRS
jgi:hypothetical protein